MPKPNSSPIVGIILFAGMAFGQPAQKPAGVAGEVRNSVTGEPIERAHIAIGRTVSGNQERYGAFTNAEGKFAINGIPAGYYTVSLDRVGYVDAPIAPLELLAGDKKENLKLKLTPTGAIVGRVLDADGEPVEGAAVSAEVGGRSERTASTDDRGIFRIGGLRPGKYRVRVATRSLPFPPEIRTDGTVEVHYASTYHPSALDAKSAMRVEVKAATEVTGVDIRMIRTPIIRVAGQVSGIPPGTQQPFISLRPQGMGVQIKADGNFEIWRVSPGRYTITASSNDGGKQYISAPVVLEVGQSDVENVMLQMQAVGELQGQVIYEDEEARKLPRPPGPPPGEQTQTSQRPAPVRYVSLRGTDESMPAAPIKEDGSFTLPRVPPGSYRVTITQGPVYVKSMSLGPANFDGALLDFTAGAGSAPLVLHVATAKGAIGGVVSDDKGPVSGAQAILAEESLERGFSYRAVSKEDGSYTIAGVAPGKYRIFVIGESDMSQVQASLEQFDDIAEKVEIHDLEALTRNLKRK